MARPTGFLASGQPVGAMTVGKGGLKLHLLAEGASTPIDFVRPRAPLKMGEPPNICGIMMIVRTGTGEMKSDVRGSTMTQFAQRLSQFSGRTVIETTGIAVKFNFHLEFARYPAIPGQNFPRDLKGDMGNAANSSNPLSPSEPGPDLCIALQAQIGPKLSSKKGQVSVLIIDHVEKPNAN